MSNLAIATLVARLKAVVAGYQSRPMGPAAREDAELALAAARKLASAPESERGGQWEMRRRELEYQLAGHEQRLQGAKERK